METFNIKTTYGQEEIVLTILQENHYYLVIYYGGIFGAVSPAGKKWKIVPHEEIEAGPLPQYERGRPGERIEIAWSDELAQNIGTEIQAHLDAED